MASIRPAIVTSNRRKDGSFVVYIRVTHAGKSRRLPTSILCYQTDLTRGLKIKNATILARAEEICREMRSHLEGVDPFTLESWDVCQIVAHIRRGMEGESFRLDFFDFAEGYLKAKEPQTRRAYTGALNTLERFLGERRLDVNDITRQLLLDFVEFVEDEPKMHRCAGGVLKAGPESKRGTGASARHIMKLANIFQAAKERYNDEDAGRILIPRSPFDKIPRHQPPGKGQRNLGVEVTQRIISADACGSLERTALDAFVVSFALMGANMADLYRAQEPDGGVWTYNRQKTESRRADGALMRVAVPPEAAPFVERLRKRKARGGWWLPGLRIGGSKDGATALVNRALHAWAEREGVAPFTFYAARHTWASLARSCGVDKGTIDDCLGHKGAFALADIYAEKAWPLTDAANRKVLALFSWG